MTQHVVVGTAGHVDHGKTALVAALTGTDTDRWAEEKRRGITIDLGFAHLDLGDGWTASIVDVPGHEDFVRNMVAGATGIDVALLVVAADEGIMPQTDEHLAILDFLGVVAGVPVITKVDLVEDEWLDLVRDDLRERLDASGVEWSDPVAVSVKSGVGLDDVRKALGRACRAVHAERGDDLFRLPVDRVFSVAGAGTVVTGTSWSGRTTVGADVRVLPGAATGRIRGIEVHGVAVDHADPRCRTAMSLVGVDRAEVRRGTWVVTDAAWRATRRVDARVTLLPTARAITQRSRLRIHLGTAEVMARVTPAGEGVQPGGVGVVRLRLEEPLVCRWGDRGVIRSYSPMATTGGFVVIDPFPAERPRRPAPERGRWDDDPVQRVVSFVNVAGAVGVPVTDLAVRAGLRPAEVATVLDRLPVEAAVRVGSRLRARADLRTVEERALEGLSEYHAHAPLEPGMPLEEFRREAGDEEVAAWVRDRLEGEGRIVVEGRFVRLAGHVIRLDEGRARSLEIVQRALSRAGPTGVILADLEGVSDFEANELIQYLVREGRSVRVGGDRYYDRAAIDGIVRQVDQMMREHGAVTAGEVRDRLGLSRKYVIPLLEWLDAQGITYRDGDTRRPGPAAESWGRNP